MTPDEWARASVRECPECSADTRSPAELSAALAEVGAAIALELDVPPGAHIPISSVIDDAGENATVVRTYGLMWLTAVAHLSALLYVRTHTVALPSVTCERCGRTSYHPDDIREGYCGHCHDYTSRRWEG